MIERI